MNTMTVRQQQFFSAIPLSWRDSLKEVCMHPEIDRLVQFLQEREAAGAKIYPKKQNIFSALKETSFENVQVVIVGQDPYHGPGQAHGLSFSVPEGIAIPPSLRNIFKELHADIGGQIPAHGTLTHWAQQGVLLLNSLLTVEEGLPASHAGKGWEFFTDAIIKALLARKQPIVFLLWGAYAQKKVSTISYDVERHCILKSAHPSPLSVTKFLGCRHFSRANNFLKSHNMREINWLG